MMVPNFAREPFLNTRPVWLVTVVAGLLALILGLVNTHLFLESNQELATQMEFRDRLQRERAVLNEGLLAEVQALNSVRWGTLSDRVSTLNAVINEHAFSWLTLLDHLEATLPYGVRVISISPSVGDEGVELTLDAVARTRDDMLEFLDRLIDDPHFDEPLPSGEIWPETSHTIGYSFDLSMQYIPEVEGPFQEDPAAAGVESSAAQAQPAAEPAAGDEQEVEP
jgi:Tfp pilus assembly protein PilN